MRGICNIYTEHAGEFIIFVLSTVCGGIRHIHTEYAQVSDLWIFDTFIHLYTEFASEFVTFILTMRGNLSYLYLVCRGVRHIDTEYAGEFYLGIFVTYINSAAYSEWIRQIPLHIQYKYDEFPCILSIIWTIPPHTQCVGECWVSHPVCKLGDFFCQGTFFWPIHVSCGKKLEIKDYECLMSVYLKIATFWSLKGTAAPVKNGLKVVCKVSINRQHYIYWNFYLLLESLTASHSLSPVYVKHTFSRRRIDAIVLSSFAIQKDSA